MEWPRGRLRDLGVGRQEVHTLVRRGELVRLRRDVVVDGNRWRAARPWERHELRARGMMCSLMPHGVEGGPSRVALSHHSGLAVSGISLHGVDDIVHVVRMGDGQGRRSTGLQVHPAVPAEMVTEVNGLPVVEPAMACLQVAAVFGVQAGLVSADAGLRAGAFDAEGLRRAAEAVSGRGASAARTVSSFADGRAESAGESRSRWLFHVIGLPAPLLQAVVVDGDKRFVGRVDFAFPAQRTIVEFDGLGKYAAALDLRAEKVREDRLRDLGFEVVRLTWADLERPTVVQERILRAFARSASRLR